MNISIVPAALGQPYAGAYRRRLGRILRNHMPLAGLVTVYWVAANIVAGVYGVGDELSATHYVQVVPSTVAVYLLFLALAYIVYVMVFVRPERLFEHLLREAWTRWFVAERVWGLVLLVVLLEIFFSVFTSMKAAIPVINPFAWDQAFAQWDRALHGGRDAWLLLDPILGHPWATTAVNFLYQCWLYVVFGFLVWYAFVTSDQRLRLQFFLSFFLVWMLLGTLLATVWSSAGPVYYGEVTGLENPYQALLDYLREADRTGRVWALDLHERLWTNYIEGTDQLGKGISAMPSMHVATCMLFALATSRMGRLASLLFWGYLAAVMVGSVHLAWHYAVDGYLAILLTWVIWIVVGRAIDGLPRLFQVET